MALPFSIHHPHLPPSDLAAVFALASGAEFWVPGSKPGTEGGWFAEKQKRLYDALCTGESTLSDEAFLWNFVIVGAYSSFRDSMALVYALRRHPRLLHGIVSGQAPMGPPECWGALQWRLRYMTAYSVLARVFADSRLALINKVLRQTARIL